MPENNQILSVEGQLVGMPLAGPESFSQQQLDYLKRALGVDETVLFQATSVAPGDSQQTYNLSESTANFAKMKVYIHRPMSTTGTIGAMTVELNQAQITSVGGFGVPLEYSSGFDSNQYDSKYFCKFISATQCQDLKSFQGSAWGYYAHIYKIVGVGRIAGGN